MKNIICSLLLFQFFILCVKGQASYYYTFDTKKPLSQNSSSFSVSFKQDVHWQKMVRTGHPLIKEVHGLTSGPTHNIIFELKEESQLSLKDLVDLFFPNPNLVEDMHWGFYINPELAVWLTDKLLYQPSNSWNEKKANNILLRYPEAKLQQSELGLYSISVSKLSHSISLANELVESGMVNWAQPDFMGGFTLFHTPTDSSYNEQYSFHNTGQSIDGTNWTDDIDVNAPEAWDLTLGSNTVTVGILDEGVEAHEDLEDGSGNSRLLSGYSAAGTGTGESQMASEGHGQAVAGLIAAEHNSLGIAGIAPNSQLVSAYVEANQATVVSQAVAGMQWLWKIAKVDIINNAYGFKSPDPNLYPAFVDVIDSAQIKGRGGLGCIVIYASGENQGGNTYVNFPGNRSNVITIGSVDGNGEVPSYSPFGPTIDVVVPSAGSQSNVRSIDRMDNATNNEDKIGLSIGNYLDYFGGTSSSCAIASGIAALVLSIDTSLTYTEVEAIFTNTTMDMGSPGKNDSTGFGLLRADAAISFAIGGFPVEWLDIKGELQNDQIKLEWITAFEQNNAFFEVERSTGGVFSKLGELPGAGTSSSQNSYFYTDTRPSLGTNYYRIKQVDINGKSSYSPVIEISWTQVSSLTLSDVYPNPSQSSVFFNFALPRANNAVYEVVDLQGRIVSFGTLTHKRQIQNQEIKVNNWDTGIYVLLIKSSNGQIHSKRFLVSP